MGRCGLFSYISTHICFPWSIFYLSGTSHEQKCLLESCRTVIPLEKASNDEDLNRRGDQCKELTFKRSIYSVINIKRNEHNFLNKKVQEGYFCFSLIKCTLNSENYVLFDLIFI